MSDSSPEPAETLTNAAVAERLEAFAGLLELAGASPYSTRAYRRAAELARAARRTARRARPVRPRARAPRHRPGNRGEAPRARRDRTDRRARRARARGLPRPGRRRPLDRHRTAAHGGDRPDARDPDRSGASGGRAGRPARGRSRDRPEDGGPYSRGARAADGTAPASRPPPEPEPAARRGDRRGSRRRTGRRATPLARRIGATRRGRIAEDPAPAFAAFGALPQIVAVVARRRSGARQASPSKASRSSSSSRNPDGSAPSSCARRAPPRTWPSSGRCRMHQTRRASTAGSASRGARPSSGSRPSGASHRVSSSSPTSAATSTATRRGRTARASVLEMAAAARERGYEYLAICDHTPNVRVVPGPGRRCDPPPGRGDRGRERGARPLSAFCAATECDILPDGSLDLPTTSSPSSTGCRPACTRASGGRGGELTKQVVEAVRHPFISCAQPPHRPV